MKDLRDKVAVVTGGASGIGLALVQAFVNEAMRVVIADVDPAALTAVEAQFADTDNVIVCATDVTDVASVTRLADTVFERFGACHVLCNNAGVGAPSAKVWQTTPNDWSWVFSVNLTGVVNGIHTFVPRMLASGRRRSCDQHVVVGRTHLAAPRGFGVRGQQGGGLGAHRMPGGPAGRGGISRPRVGLLPVGRTLAHRALDLGEDPAGRARS